jgi:hypothetical protein
MVWPSTTGRTCSATGVAVTACVQGFPTFLGLAAPQGFEPRYADPESAVLPLNEGATTRLFIRLRVPVKRLVRLSFAAAAV